MTKNKTSKIKEEEKSKNQKSSQQFRWPKATRPPQELDVWGPEGPIRQVHYIGFRHPRSKMVKSVFRSGLTR
jgi:hypothetical protein